MIIKSKYCTAEDICPYILGTELTLDLMHSNPMNPSIYRLELYRDADDGNFYLRVMKGDNLLVPPAHLKKSAAKLLEEK